MRRGFVVLTVLLIAGAVVLATRDRSSQQPRAVGPPPPPAPLQAFASNSVWNAPTEAAAPVDPRSSLYVSDLQRQLRETSPYINTRQYSSPVYTVSRKQRRVRVKLNQPLEQLQRAFAAVPIPPGARPAAGTDAHMTVWQPSTDTLWEFFATKHDAQGWSANYGGRMSEVSRNPGYFTDPPKWGATGTSLPLLGGLIRIAEFQRREIPHALALSLPQTRAGAFVPPAQRSDGNRDSPNAIPEGTRFRLDPALDLATLKLPALTLAIARAAQRYGMIVRDQAGAVTLYGEDPQAGDPYNALFGPQGARGVMAAFPWERLQAIVPPARG